MKNQTRLKLKPLEKADPDSLRIYDITRKTIEDFNGYVADFHETIRILRENQAKPEVMRDGEQTRVIDGDIRYIEDKIEELSRAMQKIAEDMSFLVEVEEENLTR